MDRIIERDNGTSAVALFLGILAVAALVALALYFFRVYPFHNAQPTGIQIDVTSTEATPS